MDRDDGPQAAVPVLAEHDLLVPALGLGAEEDVEHIDIPGVGEVAPAGGDRAPGGAAGGLGGLRADDAVGGTYISHGGDSCRSGEMPSCGWGGPVVTTVRRVLPPGGHNFVTAPGSPPAPPAPGRFRPGPDSRPGRFAHWPGGAGAAIMGAPAPSGGRGARRDPGPACGAGRAPWPER
ncbi:hypothetical protein GCM10027160_08170 [Streptomyces calidiresistens]